MMQKNSAINLTGTMTLVGDANISVAEANNYIKGSIAGAGKPLILSNDADMNSYVAGADG